MRGRRSRTPRLPAELGCRGFNDLRHADGPRRGRADTQCKSVTQRVDPDTLDVGVDHQVIAAADHVAVASHARAEEQVLAVLGASLVFRRRPSVA
jgi:hypothetical protein